MANLKTILFTGAVAVALGISLVAQRSVAQSWKSGDAAPAFSGTASDGKTHSLASLRRTGKPTVLYFIGNTCPVNAQAVKYYVRVANAYKGKVNFVGVIDTNKAGYDQWQRRFKVPFPVIFDPEMKIIQAYKAERSPWTIMINAQGRITHEWPGYSVGEINELSQAIARANKMTAARIDTSGAPQNPRYG